MSRCACMWTFLLAIANACKPETQWTYPIVPVKLFKLVFQRFRWVLRIWGRIRGHGWQGRPADLGKDKGPRMAGPARGSWGRIRGQQKARSGIRIQARREHIIIFNGGGDTLVIIHCTFRSMIHPRAGSDIRGTSFSGIGRISLTEALVH